MNKNFIKHLITSFGLIALCACGTWVGNPKKGDKNPPKQVIAGPGDVIFQSLQIDDGADLEAKIGLEKYAGLLDLDDYVNPFEISLIDSDGKEITYQRTDADNAEIVAGDLPAGDYTIAIKNNTDSEAIIASESINGPTIFSEFENANDRESATFAKYTLKSVVTFSRQCVEWDDDGNSIEFDAPEGEYYVQSFVFLGEVDNDKHVSPVSSATIKILHGKKSIELSKLSDFNQSVYREFGASKADHLEYTLRFYQGYFSAAGEMYTTDIFRFGGDCANATTFKFGTDVGQEKVTLQITDDSTDPGIDVEFPVRPTISTAFSTYESSKKKLTDYTQCTYDRTTGEPKTYNGEAGSCKTFSLSDPPYVTLDYKMPSGLSSDYTELSDPTRILFYGHSYPKIWYKTLLKSSDEYLSEDKKEISLPGCLNSGGLIAVPVSKDKTYVPLGEFNTSEGDVINLARRTGSYTALTEFYQGNVDVSDTFDYPTCIPSSTGSCDGIRTLNVTTEKCWRNADSGISATAISDSFIYPSYFEMSGIIEE